MAASESDTGTNRRYGFVWTLAGRFFLLMFFAFSVVFCAMGMIFHYLADTEVNQFAPSIRATLRADHDLKLRHLVQVAHSQLEGLAELQREGSLSPEEARKLGADLVRKISYGKDGYFWADDFEGNNIVLLGSGTEGTHRWDARDSDGKYFIRELSIAGRQPGGGYVDYQFPRPGQTKPVAKRGYALAFEPFHWVIGTGQYLDEIEDLVAVRVAQAHRAVDEAEWRFSTLLAVVWFVVVGATLFLSLRISRPLKELRERLDNLSSKEPDLDLVLEARSRDDVAQLILSFNTFLSRYRDALRRQSSYQILTKKLALLAEAHDVDTSLHTVRVGELSAILARGLGYSESDAEAVQLGATLHDVGKLFLDPHLLNKQGRLSEEERRTLQRHTVLAETLLDGPEFQMERMIAVYHHERFDGSGYPYGLKGEEIPIWAQIVGVADVYDALRSARPYKAAMAPAEALRTMREGDSRMGGGGFNPDLLRVLEERLEEVERLLYRIPKEKRPS